ncbi:MAG: hypothetical protein O3A46_14445, partial [Candidatus Poribacteria bacterium]|nr:hypothetical protein [Candidatus Poribacteria bacterium]
ARPEILFNLPVSGVPAHFFIYHIYPYVDLFGAAAWVEGAARYVNLRDDATYDAFVNTLTVGFAGGGIGQWTWAGGIDVNSAEQHERCVMTRGTLLNNGDGWRLSTREGEQELSKIASVEESSVTHHDQWLSEIRMNRTDDANRDAQTALNAIRISLSAEQAMETGRRIILAEPSL